MRYMSIVKITLLTPIFFVMIITTALADGIVNPNFTNDIVGWSTQDCTFAEWSAAGGDDPGSMHAFGTAEVPCLISQTLAIPAAQAALSYTIEVLANCPVGADGVTLEIDGLDVTCTGQGIWASCEIPGKGKGPPEFVLVKLIGDCYLDNVYLGCTEEFLPYQEINGYTTVTVTLSSGRIGVIEYRVSAGDIGVMVIVALGIFMIVAVMVMR